MDEQVDRYMDRQIKTYICKYKQNVDGRIGRLIASWEDEQIDRWIDRLTDRWIASWKDEQIDRWIDRLTDRQIDGQID